VPDGLLAGYLGRMRELFGEDSCRQLAVRQAGAAMLEAFNEDS
jgi:hypothetical protein